MILIPLRSLVVYKNRPAIVSGIEGDKIHVSVYKGETVKVREKDLEFLHPGPTTCADLEKEPPGGNVREAWELLLEAGEGGSSIAELAELIYGSSGPGAVWAAYELLKDELYFSGDISSIRARPRELVEEDEKKRAEKQRESTERAAFLEKLKKLPPWSGVASSGGITAGGTSASGVPAGVTSGGPAPAGGTSISPAPAGNIPADAAPTGGSEGSSLPGEKLTQAERRFLYDVEALARGSSDKSRTLKELGRSETPEEAHRLLLALGVWTVWENPHPGRFGLNRESAGIETPPPPDEERADLRGMSAYAIDNPWSDDPDDAVSLEGPDSEGKYCLWVHVADPAASILPGSPADAEAMGRGATLYLPEGASRMLGAGAEAVFALGSGPDSPALSIKIGLKPNAAINSVEIFPSLIKATRLSYAEADSLMTANPSGMLALLSALMEKNQERRLESGAVLIDFPEVHIRVSSGKDPAGAENKLSVEPMGTYRSADMVRECMILAGEAAARWALQRQLPFPYISQEAGELPEKRLPGLAGAWQLRRCMRPRILSVKPAVHWGLGLDEYTQVSSPLRRYTDLVCHQQIRAFLKSGAYSSLSPLSSEEVLFRISAAEAAASAVSRAEKASRSHWLSVFLLDKKGSLWDGIVLDRKGNKGVVIISALGMETQVSFRGSEEPNSQIQLSLSSVRIPEAEVSFSVV